MRKVALMALLFSAQAFACPDLTGTYTCTYQDGSTEVINVSQETKNNVVVYNYNGSTIPADNNSYPIPDDESLKQGTFRGWCAGASLKTNVLGKYYNNGSYFGDLDMTMDLSLDAGNIKSVTTGTLTDTNNTVYPLDGEVTCTRN